MSGHETVGVVLHTTGGVPLVQQLTFNQEGGFYEATITAIEVQPPLKSSFLSRLSGNPHTC